MRRPHHSILLLLLLLLTALLLAACETAEPVVEPPPADAPTVIEPGITPVQPPQQAPSEQPDTDEPAELFPDHGEATTVADLVAAQNNIDSYYFEQTIQYLNGHMFMQVWYAGRQMKVATSVDGVSQSEFYYDYDNMTVTTYYPGVSEAAMMLDFDAASADAPENPKTRDYAACTLLGMETINRQLCLILETAEGSKIWVGTKYGFPLQVQYVDSLGEEFTAQYRNISINTVDVAEVQPPADLLINNFSSTAP